jgi:dihydroorotase
VYVDLLITNAKIYTDRGLIDGGLAIDDGLIQKIAKEANLPEAASKIDAGGKIVLPGLVDAHVHLRDLDLSYKEDFYTGTCAAAAGGFTTVCDMPNTVPPTRDSSLLKEKMDVAAKKVVTNVGFYCCFPEMHGDFEAVANLGAVGFKVYLHHPLTKLNIQDDDVFSSSLKSAAEVGMPVVLHAEDYYMINSQEEDCKKSGRNSFQDYLSVHSPEAELKAVKRVLSLAEGISVQLHFVHITSVNSLKLIIQAKKIGQEVTCEVTPHNLLLTYEDLLRLGGICLMDPPPRDSSTVSEMWRYLNGGAIDIIASDHAPHPLEDKLKKNVWEVPAGIPGLETTLPLMLTEVNNGRLTLDDVVRYLSEKPSRIFHLPNKGRISRGLDADLTIIDLGKQSTINSDSFYSKAKYSPFNGRKVKGKAVKTIVAGKIVMEDDEIVADPGSGSVLRINRTG